MNFGDLKECEERKEKEPKGLEYSFRSDFKLTTSELAKPIQHGAVTVPLASVAVVVILAIRVCFVQPKTTTETLASLLPRTSG